MSPNRLWVSAGEVHSRFTLFIRFSSNHFPSKRIWRNKVPPKVAFFAWTIALEKDLDYRQPTEAHGDYGRLVLHVQTT